MTAAQPLLRRERHVRSGRLSRDTQKLFEAAVRRFIVPSVISVMSTFLPRAPHNRWGGDDSKAIRVELTGYR